MGVIVTVHGEDVMFCGQTSDMPANRFAKITVGFEKKAVDKRADRRYYDGV